MSKVCARRYYVYGVGLDRMPIAYIGWTEKQPDKEKQEILCELAESGNDLLRRRIAEAGHRAEIDVFEIEAFSSLSEALEAVDFWDCYFPFLGFNLSLASEALNAPLAALSHG